MSSRARSADECKLVQDALRQALAKAEASDRMLSALMDNVPEGITICDAGGKLRMVSQHGQDLLGGPHADKSIAEVVRDWTVYGSDGRTVLPMEELPLMRALKGESVRDVELVQVSADGRRLPLLCNAAPIRDAAGRIVAAVVAWRDITERKKAEAAIRESEARYRSLVENAPVGIFEIDLVNRKLISVNDVVCMESGYSREELLSMSALDLLEAESKRQFLDLMPRIAAGETVHESVEYEIRTKTGATRWTLLNANFARVDGIPVKARVTATDITARKTAEESLRRSEARYRILHQSLRDAFVQVDMDGRIIEFNDVYSRMLGYSPEELRALTYEDLTPERWRAFEADIVRNQIIPRGYSDIYEKEYRRKDGTVFPVELRTILSRDESGRPIAMWAIIRDISERKKAEAALRESEARFRLALKNAPVSVSAQDRDLRFVWAYNQRSARPDQIIGRFDHEIFTAEEAAQLTAVKRRVLQEGVELREQRWLDRPNGRVFLDICWEPIRDESGAIVGVASATVDQTSIKLAEEALARSLQKNSEILASIQDDFYVLDRGWVFVYANRNFTSKIGKTPEDFVGRNIWEMFPKHLGTIFEANLREAMDRREIRRFEIPGQYTKAWYRMTAFPSAEGITVLGTDITEIKRAEELRQALAEQEKLRLGAAVEQASDSVVMVDLDGTIRYVNAAFESVNGIAREAAAGTSYFDLLAGEPAAAAAIRGAVAGGRTWHGPLTRPGRDGRPVELEVTISPAKDPSGAVIGGLITEKDVTRENALQNQVRQSQKMEALGTLAGGITHDFNNVLGAIVINAELALLELDPANPARRSLPLVLQAANRGKELVKQIITFSRQRTWERKPLGVVPIVKEGLKFLRTTLPKDISIKETIDARSGVVLADPSHIHQVLVNLCQNAALAMADGGGRLEVSLAPFVVDEAMTTRNPNLKPGPYARLTVSDTGCGMSKDVQERIFEPFFTTRGPGGGSGLGLAVVHGIVRTYDGEITVCSEPGRGSTFSVYLPRLEDEGPAADAEDRAEPRRGEERILLVEDEKAQRESLERGLSGLGYRVTARADGRSALTAFRKDPGTFDLVITDQVMPGMTGLELAAAISALRPDIPIVLCTGFSEKVNGGVVGQSGIREMIMKPFTLREITGLIRRVVSP